MNTLETGPARPRPLASQSTPSLTSLLPLTVRIGRGDKARMMLKNAFLAKTDCQLIDDSQQIVFYHQHLTASTYAQVSQQFCQLAWDPSKSILR